MLTISISIVKALFLRVLSSSPFLSTEVKKAVRNWKPPREIKLYTKSAVESGAVFSYAAADLVTFLGCVRLVSLPRIKLYSSIMLWKVEGGIY